jgi:large subunit ribosomal protein L32
MRHNRSQTRSRRSHHALKEPTLTKCSHCGDFKRPHHMCLSCGFYNGRQVMDLESERAKRDERIKAKKERIRLESGVADTPADVRTEEAAAETKAAKKSKAKTEDKEVDAPEAERR